MAINFMLPLRIVQFIFGIIVLATAAYVVSNQFHSPSQFNYLVFCGVWACVIAVPFLTLAPRFFPSAAHKFAILGVELLSSLFFFAGFIAAAVFLNGADYCIGGVCRAGQASTVFAAFEWALFTATTVMATLHVMRTRGTGNTKGDPNMQTV